MNQKGLLRGSVAVPIIVILGLLILVVGYFVVTNVIAKNSGSSVNTPYATPTSPITDFAPSIPLNQKTTIVVRQSDSSTVTYLVPTAQVESFIQKLPEGEAVVSKTANR